MKYIFLSKQFYTDYESKNYPEIMQKELRPYVMLLVEIDGVTFAIPFRSNVGSKYSFITDKVNNKGIDYSKAVVISDLKYIDDSKNPRIGNNEHKSLFGKKREIYIEFSKYVNDYKKAVSYKARRLNTVYKYSTLQYFHKELGL